MSVAHHSARLQQLERRATAEEALAFFDSLPAVNVEHLLGAWRGAGLATGHPLDGLLERLGWHGKRFDAADAVHPLVMGEGGGRFNLIPSIVPLGWVRRNARLLAREPVAAVARRVMPWFRTDEPQARACMSEFRGVVSATMVYDKLPIRDVFRRVDGSTLLGVMDARGDVAPHYFYFVLHREG